MENIMKVRIKDFTTGDTATSYEEGKKCLDFILQGIDSENVILDFSGINYVITAFLNPVIGDLILQKGESVMKKINIQNANQYAIEKIKMVKEGALLKREDIEE